MLVVDLNIYTNIYNDYVTLFAQRKFSQNCSFFFLVRWCEVVEISVLPTNKIGDLTPIMWALVLVGMSKVYKTYKKKQSMLPCDTPSFMERNLEIESLIIIINDLYCALKILESSHSCLTLSKAFAFPMNSSNKYSFYSNECLTRVTVLLHCVALEFSKQQYAQQHISTINNSFEITFQTELKTNTSVINLKWGSD